MANNRGLPKQIRELFGQYESYVALTRISIGMRHTKKYLVVGFLPTGGIDINERIKINRIQKPSEARR